MQKKMPIDVKKKMPPDIKTKTPSDIKKKMPSDIKKKTPPDVEKKMPTDIKKKIPLDVWTDILDVQVNPERLTKNLASYTEIHEEIKKLRALDLTDVHPAIIFEPTAPYRKLEKS